MRSHCRFYHVVNPQGFSWTDDLLPALRGAGLTFGMVSPQEWVERLRNIEQDPELNPTIKLLSTYERKYTTGSGEHDEDRNTLQVRFDTTNARAVSRSMREAPDIIREGYVKKFVARWLEKWKGDIGVNGT
jgi:hypothetical protein